MTWDLYLILKTGGIAVFVFAGGISVAKALNISRERAYFINASAVIVGFIINRFWYIIQHIFGKEEYAFRSITQFGEAWAAWDDAGSVLYGWILGGTFTMMILCRVFKLSPRAYLDKVLPWLLIAQVLNRLGCADAGCCYGKGSIPVQLLEAFFDLALFIFIRMRCKRPGSQTVAYFIGYPAARFFLEFMRGDNQPALWFMTVPQVTSVLILVVILANRKKILAA
jgi:prolipoprotein diacylglyceryltransferase